MFDNVLAMTGGVNRWFYHRARRPSSTSHPPRPHVAPLHATAPNEGLADSPLWVALQVSALTNAMLASKVVTT